MNTNWLTLPKFIGLDIDETYFQYLPPQQHELCSKYAEILGVFTTYSQALRFIEENGGENPIEYPEFGDTYDRSGAHLTISTITDEIYLDLKNGEQIYIHIVIRGGSWNHDMCRDIGVCGATEVSEEEINNKDVFEVYLPDSEASFEMWLYHLRVRVDDIEDESDVLEEELEELQLRLIIIKRRLNDNQ